jgi:hypothetical protein
MQRTEIVIGAIVIIATVGIIGVAVAMSPPPSSSLTNREVAAQCVSHTGVGYHIHPVLSIVVNGIAQKIPADVGITPSCMRALHIHDDTGKIHIETPQKRDFTLGDFFFNWNQPFSREEILGFKADDTHVIRMTVNGNEVDTYENTPLYDLDQIVITYEERSL